MRVEGQTVRCLVREEARRLLSPPKRLALVGRSLLLKMVEFASVSTGVQGLYIGEGLSLRYLMRLYGAQPAEPKVILCTALSDQVDRARRNLPLVIVEINSLLAGLCPSGGFRTWPWIRHILDLEGPHYLRRQRGIERSYGWSVRRHDFRCEFSHAAADVKKFYDEFYRPHLIARHGELAGVRGLSQVSRAVRSGFLLQVFDGGEWIAGLAVTREGNDRVQLVASGLHPSRLGRWRDGALSAVYYFLIRWARENGVRFIDFGGTRAHLLDGVYRHKTLWGAEPQPDPWHHTQLVFYVDRDRALPPLVGKQLVWNGRAFLALEEAVGG